MIRYSFFVVTILATAATAIASIAPHTATKTAGSRNITVIQKNQDFPVFGPLIVTQCAVEDCSDVE